MPSSKTHIAFGFTSLILLCQGLDKLGYNDPDNIYLFSGIIFGSTFPDIDQGSSWASSTVPWIDDFLRKIGILKHRGITHSIGAIVVFLVAPYFIYYNYSKYYWFSLIFCVGALSHIVLDFFTSKIFRVRCGNKDSSKDKKALLDFGMKENVLYNLIWILNFVMISSIYFGVDYLKIINSILIEFGLNLS